ncbi:nudix hydrolase-like protein [Leptotrombidium deliense]|uniref:Nudix hydrolase-like protein n=1 Tax=Leptotrombidium deliense TaxID=299467 RepID=A0A443S883_9ACAR|nr:nudix hydrolase-like protein [Leptotrombidium deliense]
MSRSSYFLVVFANRIPAHKPHGLFSVEHNANEADGVCFTVLVSCKEPLEESTLTADFKWIQLSTDLESSLLSRIEPSKTVFLNKKFKLCISSPCKGLFHTILDLLYTKLKSNNRLQIL